MDASPLLLEYRRGIAGDGEGEGDVGVVLLSLVLVGSHGGDFSAFEALSGELQWTTQLDGQHIEAAAVAAQGGRTIVVGSFAGADVDGPTDSSLKVQ